MSGAVVLEGDVKAVARLKIAIIVGILMGRKNVPRSIPACEDMAAAIVAVLDMRQHFMIAHDQPDEDTAVGINMMANDWLDRDAAINMINIFTRVAGLGKIPGDAFNAVLENMLAHLKRCNPFRDEFLIWPTSEAIEQRAIASIGRGGPVDLATLEQAMRPLLVPPVPEAPAAQTRWTAWRTVATAIASLMERKNVPPG